MFDMERKSWKQIFCIVAFLCFYQAAANSSPLRIEATRIGWDIKLTCVNGNAEDGAKNRDIQWEKPSGNIIGHGSEFYLKNAENENIGEYICRLREDINSSLVNHKVITEVELSENITQEPNIPNILIPQAPNDALSLQETQNLDIICKVDNWSREDYNAQWIKSDGYVISVNERLFIESVVRKQHEGTYTCAVSHKKQQNEVFNKKITLTITKPTLSIQVLAGEKLQINGLIHRKCSGFKLEQSTEIFSYTWRDSEGRTISKTDTIQVPINDATVFGTYQCCYRGRKSGKTFVKEVNISEERFDSLSSSYLITIIPYPQRFRLNEKFSMRCQMTPTLKDIKYTWFKDDELLEDKQQTLSFDSFTRANLGVYKCRVTGMNEQNIQIKLEAKTYQRLSVFVPVKVELIEGAGTQVSVIMSKKKELHCEVSPDSGHSGDQVQWIFESKELSTQDSLNNYNMARFNNRHVSILVLNNAKLINEGNYQCKVGGVTKAVNIVIIQDEGILSVSPGIERRFEGQPAEFHCRVNNIPNLKNTDIQWHFVGKDGSQRVPLPNERWKTLIQNIADETSFISIDSAEMEDNGYFICSLPTGQESKAELIVSERIRQFVVKISPPVINVRKSQRFEFECFTQDKVGNPTGEPILKFLNGSLVSDDRRFTVSKVGPSRIRLVAPFGLQIDASELKMICGIREKVATVTINVRDICPSYHRYCRSGECIANQKFCDGIINCADGSDEDVAYCNSCDPISKPCGHLTSNNTTNQHFSINWACDGENDCTNGFDEQHCDTSSKCNTRQFTCNDGVKIPYGYLCDKSADCSDGEDEFGCSSPQIIKTSNREIRAKSGSTVKLTCEVVGYPLPKVTWRFNWNCLPDDTRMTIKEINPNCKKITSVLTLDNFQAGDDAIYNCEAVGGESRALSEPFQVTLDD